ncbi:MAG: phospholipase D-like domain-containing protein, partial [Planctomycetota bacterium]
MYCVLGINRVSRRAARLSQGVVRHEDVVGRATLNVAEVGGNIAIVAALVERVTHRRLARGNAVSILRNGDEAYPAMLAAIRGARHSVALASYIFRVDNAGLSFVDALVEARSRGVEIRVLVDGVGAGYFFSPIVRRLKKEGIPVARFLHNWVPWRMPFLNIRNHNKILVVDGAIGFTGGLNIGAENVVALRPANPVCDVHFRVEGPVVSQLMLTFAEDWDFTTRELLDDDVWWPDLAPLGALSARGISSGPDQDIGTLEAMLATAAAAARRRLRITTPYFLPDEHLMSTIASAALGGVEVDIVLPERSD